MNYDALVKALTEINDEDFVEAITEAVEERILDSMNEAIPFDLPTNSLRSILYQTANLREWCREREARREGIDLD